MVVCVFFLPFDKVAGSWQLSTGSCKHDLWTPEVNIAGPFCWELLIEGDGIFLYNIIHWRYC